MQTLFVHLFVIHFKTGGNCNTAINIMKKLVEISEDRVAAISLSWIWNKPAIEQLALGMSDEQMSHFTLHDKTDLLTLKIKSVEILSSTYESKSTTLTGQDLVLIQRAANEMIEEERHEPYTLMDYYS